MTHIYQNSVLKKFKLASTLSSTGAGYGFG